MLRPRFVPDDQELAQRRLLPKDTAV